MNAQERKDLLVAAAKVRLGIIEGVYHAKSGHPGGSLSSADIFTYLYFKEMNINPQTPKDPNRDRFVLSKGHCAPGLYSVLANRGYFDVSELQKLRHIGAMLQGHPDMKGTPGVDMSSGSLGQGISAAVGMALAGKLDNKDYRVYTLLGDGGRAGKGFRRGPRLQGQALRHHRQDHQGQGRLLYGGPGGLARQGPQHRAVRSCQERTHREPGGAAEWLKW